MMLAAQRRAAILDRVRSAGAVRVAELVAELGVSDMTIRRDLDTLAERRLVSKVHGGATVPGSADEPGFAAKSARQRAEKAAIARTAAGLVAPGSAVGLSAGTTTAALAELLVGVADLTVVTNSVPVAQVLREQTVILTGGERTRSDALVGPVAVAAIGSLHLDTLFLGVHGMSEAAGYTTPNLLEAETNRALVRSTARLVVVADHTKWATAGMCTIAPLAAADVLVTDAGLAAPARQALSEAVGELLVAPC
jgi:DeoR/GlpR family transcriptional regulator of sugar metabolism